MGLGYTKRRSHVPHSQDRAEVSSPNRALWEPGRFFPYPCTVQNRWSQLSLEGPPPHTDHIRKGMGAPRQHPRKSGTQSQLSGVRAEAARRQEGRPSRRKKTAPGLLHGAERGRSGDAGFSPRPTSAMPGLGES